MSRELTPPEATVLFSAIAVLFVCAVVRMVLVRKITLEAGLSWNLGQAFERSRNEWTAIKSLPDGTRKRQYRVLIGTVLAGSVVAAGTLALSAWKK